MSEENDGLKTLSESGTPPETRMQDAQAATNRIQTLLNAEKKGRSQRRTMVKGLVDGNPPYRASDQRKAGRAAQCNVNWRVAEYYLNRARSAFYDIFSEAPTYVTVKTAYGNAKNQENWSRIITEEWDRTQREDRSWDYSQQISQYEMILYGCGPVVFEDDVDWRNRAVLNRELIVPDFTKSDPTQWEEAVILQDYSADKLYGFIRNEKVAKGKGWDVEATKKAIMQAHPKTAEGGQYGNWEWHQQSLKNQSFGYSSQSKVISCSHYLYREFPKGHESEGRITHAILVNPTDSQTETANKYLFQHVGRFENWDQIIHPMYYDNDGGGYHHSVTGMGQKMFSAMEYQNRLLCNMADKVFAPKILFKPTTAAAGQQLSIVQFAEWGQVPPNFDVLQTPVGSFSEEGLVFNRELTQLIASNLSQYNQSVKKQDGNPITATQAQIEASEQARLGKTQLNHWYAQADRLYAERYRRAVNPALNGFMPGGKEAIRFWARCKERGVPIQALRQVESVKATRIIGQGSQFMRQQALEKMLDTLALWPSESGRNNLLSDFIASQAGQGMVERYNPSTELTSDMDDQKAFAHLQIASAKDGIAPVVTGSQNHFLFAQEFLLAGSAAASSLQQGGDPMEVYAFIEVIGPSIMQHLEYVKNDPTRAKQFKQMQEQWLQLSKFHSQLGQKIQKMQQEQAKAHEMQQRARAVQNGHDPEIQLQAAEMQAKLDMKSREKAHSMELKQRQANQKLAINDATTANKIVNERRKQAASAKSETTSEE
jgi:hypothetical protein